MIGTIISKYKVETLLNKGINCEIYSGINTETRQKVTIHRINRQLILANVEIKLKIKNDLYTLSQISNPAIEAIYEYVTYEDDLVYISEFVEGVPLNKYLDKTASDKFARLSVLENKFLPKILQGLSAVHSKGICHGHLRPSNILITRNEDVKIINWGLAELSELDKISKNVGAIEYLSPEQIQKRPVDIRSDVYSLGVTLFELITGKKPYSGLASDAEISSKINDESFLLTMGEDENLPEKYAAVIKKATEKFPENRISVGQIISELSTVNVSPNIPEKPNPVPFYQQPPVNVVKQTYTRPPTPKPEAPNKRAEYKMPKGVYNAGGGNKQGKFKTILIVISVIVFCFILVRNRIQKSSHMKFDQNIEALTDSINKAIKENHFPEAVDTGKLRQPVLLSEDSVYAKVDEKPEFPDGQNGLNKWIKNTIKYPDVARQNGIKGKVVVSFIIEKDGRVSDAKSLNDIGGGCAEEAVRDVYLMPGWKPAKISGTTVRSRYTLPIIFK